MAEMSKGIREVLERHGAGANADTRLMGLKAIPTETLDEFVQIIGAFYLDLKDELDRRS